MRYIRQKTEWSCGPICIINAMKWCGLSATYAKDYRRICESCNHTPGEGTEHLDLHRSIVANLGDLCTIKSIGNLKIDTLARHVEHKDRAALVSYAYPLSVCKEYGMDVSHIFFCESYNSTHKAFSIANLIPEIKELNKYSIFPRWLLVRFMRNRREFYSTRHPFAWLLRKR